MRRSRWREETSRRRIEEREGPVDRPGIIPWSSYSSSGTSCCYYRRIRPERIAQTYLNLLWIRCVFLELHETHLSLLTPCQGGDSAAHRYIWTLYMNAHAVEMGLARRLWRDFKKGSFCVASLVVCAGTWACGAAVIAIHPVRLAAQALPTCDNKQR